MFRKAGIENSFHLLVTRQEFGNDAAMAIMLFHANREGFHSPEHQPAFEGRKNGAGGFLNESELCGLLLSGTDDDPAEAVAVSIEKLGSGVNHHVSTEGDRLLEI